MSVILTWVVHHNNMKGIADEKAERFGSVGSVFGVRIDAGSDLVD
jgi:hypothetical protein